MTIAYFAYERCVWIFEMLSAADMIGTWVVVKTVTGWQHIIPAVI